DVFTATTREFVEVLSAQAQLALNEELVRLAEQVLRTVAARVQVGQVSPVEETRARVALSTSHIVWGASSRSRRPNAWPGTSVRTRKSPSGRPLWRWKRLEGFRTSPQFVSWRSHAYELSGSPMDCGGFHHLPWYRTRVR